MENEGSVRKRTHDDEVEEFSAKRPRSGLSFLETWVYLLKMRKYVFAYIHQLNSASLNANTETLVRKAKKGFTYFHAFCLKAYRYPGALLFACLTAVSVSSLAAFRDSETRHQIYELFNALFVHGREEFNLLMDQLFTSNTNGSVGGLLSAAKQGGGLSQITVLPPYCFTDEFKEVMEVSGEPQLFHCLLRSGHDRAALHVLHVMNELLVTHPLWRPLPSTITPLLDACSIVLLRNPQSEFYNKCCASILVGLKRRQCINLQKSGCFITYFVSAYLLTHEPTLWEVELFAWVAEEIQHRRGSHECDFTWLGAFFTAPGALKTVVQCILHLYQASLRMESLSLCDLYVQCMEYLTAIVQHAAQECGSWKSAKTFSLLAHEIELSRFFSQTFSDILSTHGRSSVLVRCSRDPFDVSFRLLQQILSLFNTEDVTEWVRQAFSSRAPAVLPSSIDATDQYFVRVSYTVLLAACGNLLLSAAELSELLASDLPLKPHHCAGAIKSSIALLGLVMQQPADQAAWSAICARIERQAAFVVDHVNYRTDGVFIAELTHELTFLSVEFSSSHHRAIAARLQKATHFLINASRAVDELFALSISGATFGLHQHTKELLCQKVNSPKKWRESTVRDHLHSLLKIDLLLSCFDHYLWIIADYKTVLSIDFVRHATSQPSDQLSKSTAFLITPLLKSISTVQLQLYLSVLFLAQLLHDDAVRSSCSVWLSKYSKDDSADEEVYVVPTQEVTGLSFMALIAEQHGELFPLLFSLLNEMGTCEDVNFRTSLRRAACGALAFSCSSLSLEDVERFFSSHILPEDCFTTKAAFGVVAAMASMRSCPSFSILRSTVGSEWPRDLPFAELSRPINFLRSCCSFPLQREMLRCAGVYGVWWTLPVHERDASFTSDITEAIRLSFVCCCRSNDPTQVKVSSQVVFDPSACLTREALHEFLVARGWWEGDIGRYESTLLPRLLVYFHSVMKRRSANFYSEFILSVIQSSCDSVIGSPLMDDVRGALDVLVERQIISTASFADNFIYSAALAKLLWTPESLTSDEKESLTTTMNSVSAAVKGNPQPVLHRCLFFLVSMEGERQLLLSSTEGNDSDTACFSASLRRLAHLSLNNFGSTHMGAESDDETTRIRVSSALSWVLNAIFKMINADVTISHSRGSLECTRRRWLLGLRSLVSFLGERVTLFAPNLASMLKMIADDVHVASTSASVWCTLVLNCSSDFLQEQLPFIVSDLLALEEMCWSDHSRLLVIRDAILHLYSCSHENVVWRTYLSILSVRSGVLFDVARSVSQSPVEEEDFSGILTGFVSLAQRSSVEGKRILFLSFLAYVQSLSPTVRSRLCSNAASCGVVPTLLQAAKSLNDDGVLVVLRIVGLLGSLPITSPLLVSEPQEVGIQPSLYTSWRSMVFTLLNKHLPQALVDSNIMIHRYAAFASQEIIRLGVSSESGNVTKIQPDALHRYSWWADLNPGSRQLIEAFASTEYSLHRRSESTENEVSYQTWLWILFSRVSEFSTSRLRRILDPLRMLMKYFIPLLSAMAPYAILDALHSSESFTVIVEAFMKLFDDRKNPTLKDRLDTLLTVFDHLSVVRWSLLQLAAKKINHINVDLTSDACDEMATNIHTFLYSRKWRTGSPTGAASWVLRASASLASGNCLMALRFIEGQDRLPDLTTVEAGVGQKELRRLFLSLQDNDSADYLLRRGSTRDPLKVSLASKEGDWICGVQDCDAALQRRPDSSAHQVTLLRCLNKLGHFQLSSKFAEALVYQHGNLVDDSVKQRIAFDCSEAAWRLGDWPTVLDNHDRGTVSFAFPLAHWTRVVRGDCSSASFLSLYFDECYKLIPFVRCANGNEDYTHLSRLLHGLTDLKLSMAALSEANSFTDKGACEFVSSSLALRLRLVDNSLDAKESLLSLHKCMYEELNVQHLVPRTLESHVRLLRDQGYLEAAVSVAKQSYSDGSVDSPLLCVTTAELLYEVGRKSQAASFASHFVETSDAYIKSSLMLLLADWSLEAGEKTQEEIIRNYETAISVHPSETGHHKLALFYERVFLAADKHVPSDDPSRYAMALKAIEHFGSSLLLDCSSLSVSLPRMFTLWLDSVYALTVSDFKRETSKRVSLKDYSKHNEGAINAFNTSISKLINEIPLAYLVTSLRQLLSRLEHPNKSVVTIIAEVVVKLLRAFPQPCLWLVLPIAFSKPESVADIVRQKILTPFAQSDKTTVASRSGAEKVFQSLLAFCTLSPSHFKGTVKLRQLACMRGMEELFSSFDFILPTLSNLSPDVSLGIERQNVFRNATTFRSFDDTVVLMKSKQQPKRIRVLSSDGSLVSFLCKSEDEPRKDIRMMDLAALINRFLLQDSRSRNLSIRRYSIAALSNSCAMIEWVNDLAPFYGLVMSTYQLCRRGIDERKIKSLYDDAKAKEINKHEIFKSKILPGFPPIFHCWIHRSFANASEWYEARRTYTASTALWSIIGHVVGLGDRHGENILLNQRTGEVMHVDFAEMFDSAEQLPVPEVVRFRLTQNVVDGMGVLGTNGLFRSVCEIAVRCQARNSNALMSIAETHLYEPQNKLSKFSIQRMSRRLGGYLEFYNAQTKSVFPLSTVPLSAEGQVSKLISHASSNENLSEMYTWWRPWI